MKRDRKKLFLSFFRRACAEKSLHQTGRHVGGLLLFLNLSSSSFFLNSSIHSFPSDFLLRSIKASSSSSAFLLFFLLFFLYTVPSEARRREKGKKKARKEESLCSSNSRVGGDRASDRHTSSSAERMQFKKNKQKQQDSQGGRRLASCKTRGAEKKRRKKKEEKRRRTRNRQTVHPVEGLTSEEEKKETRRELEALFLSCREASLSLSLKSSSYLLLKPYLPCYIRLSLLLFVQHHRGIVLRLSCSLLSSFHLIFLSLSLSLSP